MTELESLRSSASQQHSAAEELISSRHYSNALEAAHMSVEISMKAAIRKAGGDPPFTHDLKELVDFKVGNQKVIHRAIRSTKFIRGTFNEIHNAWRAKYRYTGSPYSEQEIEELVVKFGQVYEWIISNLT